jgi:hypothetical protein
MPLSQPRYSALRVERDRQPFSRHARPQHTPKRQREKVTGRWQRVVNLYAFIENLAKNTAESSGDGGKIPPGVG